MKEEWRSFTDNYKVSNLGNVLSVKRGKLMSQHSRNIYKRISLIVNGKSKHYGVHQLVAMCFMDHTPNGHVIIVDHINEDKSDNRLSNLRLLTTRENLSRRGGVSKYVGVSKFRNKWMATITFNNKLKYLGLYQTEIEASEAYKIALQASY